MIYIFSESFQKERVVNFDKQIHLCEVLAVSPSREAGDRGELSEKAEWIPFPEMILNLILSFIVGISTFFLPVLCKCLLNLFVKKQQK